MDLCFMQLFQIYIYLHLLFVTPPAVLQSTPRGTSTPTREPLLLRVSELCIV